jgi:hypothetical protein
MDMNGNSMKQGRAGRYFAVLWILFAALAMQFVLSAQEFSTRASAVEKAGNFSVPESGSSDQVLSRSALRATPAADLRFAADRPDGKSMPGGDGSFLLPGTALFFLASDSHLSQPSCSPSAQTDAIGHHTRVRAPPVLRA